MQDEKTTETLEALVPAALERFGEALTRLEDKLVKRFPGTKGYATIKLTTNAYVALMLRPYAERVGFVELPAGLYLLNRVTAVMGQPLHPSELTRVLALPPEQQIEIFEYVGPLVQNLLEIVTPSRARSLAGVGDQIQGLVALAWMAQALDTATTLTTQLRPHVTDEDDYV